MEFFQKGDTVVIIQKSKIGYRVAGGIILNSITFERSNTRQYFVYWYYQKEMGYQWIDQEKIFRNWLIAQTICDQLNKEAKK